MRDVGLKWLIMTESIIFATVRQEFLPNSVSFMNKFNVSSLWIVQVPWILIMRLSWVLRMWLWMTGMSEMVRFTLNIVSFTILLLIVRIVMAQLVFIEMSII